jgi:hypothetical protein
MDRNDGHVNASRVASVGKNTIVLLFLLLPLGSSCMLVIVFFWEEKLFIATVMADRGLIARIAACLQRTEALDVLDVIPE